MNTQFTGTEVIDQVNYNCPESWEEVFRMCNERKIFDKIQQIVNRHGEYYPNPEDLFAAFRFTKYDNVKVVIFGQDPYPNLDLNGQPRATGMSFNQRESERISISNINIFKELARTHTEKGFRKPSHGCLERWAKQGVLLLNENLTLFPGVKLTANQNKFWHPFVTVVIEKVIEANPNVIFVLWGRKAQQLETYISQNAKKIIGYHPSSRGMFAENNHFVEIDEHLEQHGIEPIDWNTEEL